MGVAISAHYVFGREIATTLKGFFYSEVSLFTSPMLGRRVVLLFLMKLVVVEIDEKQCSENRVTQSVVSNDP